MEPNLYAYGPSAMGDPHAIRLTLSAEDMAAFDALPRVLHGDKIEVTDEATGFLFEVGRTSCGAGCFCAATATLVEMP